MNKLSKDHYKIDPKSPECLYCKTLNAVVDKYPRAHHVPLPFERNPCPGFIHSELQHFDAVPGVSAPEVKIIVECDECGFCEEREFFAYVEKVPVFKHLPATELVGIVFGNLHVLNSDAQLLVNFDGDPNLRPKERGKKIQIERAIAHAAMCELSDIVSAAARL